MLIFTSINCCGEDFWPIFNDTRNYRARFFWLDVEKAVNTSVPDTLDYFDSVVGIEEKYRGGGGLSAIMRLEHGHLVVEQVNEELMLDIYGLDGRKYLSRRISADEVISLSSIPQELLLIRIKGQGDAQVLKVLNQY